MLYGTLAETGDLLYMDLREGYRHTSFGSEDVLPGMIKRVDQHFREVRMRADSGYYDQKLVQICAARGVEFFIVAKKHANVMKAVHALPASAWKPFQPNEFKQRRAQRAPAQAAGEPEAEDHDRAPVKELVQRQARDSVDGISP